VSLWHEGREEERACTPKPISRAGRHGTQAMKLRLIRLAATLAAVAAVALAGGASFNGL
jgi:hypothetical protein